MGGCASLLLRHPRLRQFAGRTSSPSAHALCQRHLQGPRRPPRWQLLPQAGSNADADLTFGKHRVACNSESGSFMSCPPVEGIIGLLRTLHPDWSPAATCATLTTTARHGRRPSAAPSSTPPPRPTPSGFSYGAGQVWPSRAMNQGLLYTSSPPPTATGHYSASCATTQRYRDGHVERQRVTVQVPRLAGAAHRRRQPHFRRHRRTTVKRTVKNVGKPDAYKACVTSPAGVRIAIFSPYQLVQDAFAKKEHHKQVHNYRDLWKWNKETEEWKGSGDVGFPRCG
uniref:Peptidase S8/S53 domain-containing protein n=1 Tax=Oryza punctata TaxID=4537 RepID=A0A0E0LGJ1_ORYPU